MRISSLGFLIEEAARNIRRNGLMSVAALSTVTIALAVLGGSLFALYRLHQFAEAQPKQFEIQAFVRAELPGAADRQSPSKARRRHSDDDDSATETTDSPKAEANAADVSSIKSAAAAIPGVARVTVYSREQALAAWQGQDHKNSTNIAGALDGNPFPDRLDVHLADPRMAGSVAAALRDHTKFPDIEKVLEDRETLDQVLAISRMVRNVGGIAAILLFLATALVIQNTIRLTVFARRKEIHVMQLVGATRGFIRLPMVLEGIFYGLFGALVASGIVLLAAQQTSKYAEQFHSPLMQSMPAAVGPGIVVGGLAAMGAFVGWLGSTLSVRRFLKGI